MGQYYNVVMYNDETKKIKVFNRYTRVKEGAEPEYMPAKLTEHGWLHNDFTDTISCMIHGHRHRIAWVGDYADDVRCNADRPNDLPPMTIAMLWHMAWRTDRERMEIPIVAKFNYKRKYLVDWDKKEYVNMDRYVKNNTNKSGWCLHPLALLTAIGNGLGGGDYRGPDEDSIGRWAFDYISFENKVDKDTFTEIDPDFIEEW